MDHALRARVAELEKRRKKSTSTTKEDIDMNETQKKALSAIHAAALALAAATAALVATFDGEPAKPAAEKPKPPAAKPTPPAAKPAPPKAEPPAGEEPIEAQCRRAAKSYAEVYGREGLKEVLKKYTEGTLADVSQDKLPELLKDLGA